MSKFEDRVLDIVSAFLVGILLLPFFLVACFLILMVDGRPVFFRQQRLGLEKNRFFLYKLRTMKPGAESEHPALLERQISSSGTFLLALNQDNRVSRLGRVIRQSSLDEYPQLWNVLKGDMRMVGPRPMMEVEATNLPESFEPRFKVPPGITGLSQVSGRKKLDANKGLVLDLVYSRRRSFCLDVSILLRTPIAMIRGTGAY